MMILKEISLFWANFYKIPYGTEWVEVVYMAEFAWGVGDGTGCELPAIDHFWTASAKAIIWAACKNHFVKSVLISE